MIKKPIKYLTDIYHKLVPEYIRAEIFYWRKPKLLKLRRSKILYYLQQKLSQEPDNPEIQAILNFIKNEHNCNSLIPYTFAKKYDQRAINVYTDAGFRYVLHTGKRLYFPRGWSKRNIQYYYNGLLLEQDLESPHRYETPSFCVQEGDSVADIGAAEGIFALSVLEKAQKIYLFECERQWLEPLRKTFTPWPDKVEIINKTVSAYTGGG